MFKRVDQDVIKPEEFEGFCYENIYLNIEYVKIHRGNVKTVTLVDSGECSIEIYVSDIPKLIKALQAAEEYSKGANN